MTAQTESNYTPFHSKASLNEAIRIFTVYNLKEQQLLVMKKAQTISILGRSSAHFWK